MKNVDDIYPLTPMQRVMLLHASGASNDSLFHQFRYELRGPLDEAAFSAAWQDVAERHPALRTCFAWEGLEAPVQVVRTAAPIPVSIEDWRELSPEASADRLEERLMADRAKGFDPRSAPLVRVLLVRRDEDHWTMVWSSHHLVLDRWCIGVVLDDLTRCYESRVGGAASSAGTPGRFRDYVAWWMARPEGAAEDHWRETLRGAHSAARRLSVRADATSTEAPWFRRLSPEKANALAAAARELRVTTGSIAQLALGLALAERARRGDVLFGTTVSGRPPEVPGVESAVGSFIGNVPTRLRLDPGADATEALRALMADAQARSGHEHVAPPELHRLAALPATEPLFDALFVWLAEARWPGPDGIAVAHGDGRVQSAYPVTISVGETALGLEFAVVLEPGAAIEGGAAAFGERLVELVLAIADSPTARLGDLARFDPAGELPTTDVPGAGPAVGLRPTSCSTARSQRRGREHEDLEVITELVLGETRALIGDPAVAEDDNFFAAGGTSLQAVQLHGRIEAALGCEIPLLSLFSEPTLGAMARLLQGGEWPLRGGVVRALRDGGELPPLVCLASPDVNSVGFVNLVRHLDPRVPVLLAQVEPTSDTVFRMALSDVPELARRSIEAIEEVLPEGPIRLLGMCDGALIAMEMARQLEERGRAPEFVGILNSHALGTLSWRYKLRRVGSRIRYYRGRLREELDRRLGRSTTSDVPAAEATPPQAVEPVDSAPDPDAKARTIARLAEINREWFALDTPAGLPKRPLFGGAVTLFRIKHQPYWRIRDIALGWRRHASTVYVVDLEGYARSDAPRGRRQRHETHLGILREPDVAGTAEAIGRALAPLDNGRPRPVGQGAAPEDPSPSPSPDEVRAR